MDDLKRPTGGTYVGITLESFTTNMDDGGFKP